MEYLCMTFEVCWDPSYKSKSISYISPAVLLAISSLILTEVLTSQKNFCFQLSAVDGKVSPCSNVNLNLGSWKIIRLPSMHSYEKNTFFVDKIFTKTLLPNLNRNFEYTLNGINICAVTNSNTVIRTGFGAVSCTQKLYLLAEKSYWNLLVILLQCKPLILMKRKQSTCMP